MLLVTVVDILVSCLRLITMPVIHVSRMIADNIRKIHFFPDLLAGKVLSIPSASVKKAFLAASVGATL
jgi:hypothetical protein